MFTHRPNHFQVPPPGKDSLYNRLFLMGIEAVLGLAPAPEYTFLSLSMFLLLETTSRLFKLD
ncbi:hypothetical protein Bca4012_043951 [Brassica carinata]|uniref:(rape) hypothetical protein n=1 Tax=Brassica napus TaxID=3708 RepID=A0A816J0A1_BRANA|nr:unnamed protein product [Brassica napus]